MLPISPMTCPASTCWPTLTGIAERCAHPLLAVSTLGVRRRSNAHMLAKPLWVVLDVDNHSTLNRHDGLAMWCDDINTCVGFEAKASVQVWVLTKPLRNVTLWVLLMDIVLYRFFHRKRFNT